MSKKIAVIGLGNTLRRDDGIGIAVLESLLTSYKRQGIDYLNFGIASFDLLHRIQDYGAALLIDAIDGGLAYGGLKIFELYKIGPDVKQPLISSHELDLRAISELYKKLNLKTKVYVAGIQVKDVSYGEGFSGPLKNKQKEIVEEISIFIDNTLNKFKQ